MILKNIVKLIWRPLSIDLKNKENNAIVYIFSIIFLEAPKSAKSHGHNPVNLDIPVKYKIHKILQAKSSTLGGIRNHDTF